MKIQFIVPPGTGPNNGNRRTAERWAKIVRTLGHKASVRSADDLATSDVLVALHAVKSYPAMQEFRRRHPKLPIVVGLTGTDLYGTRPILPALKLASSIIALQREALRKIPKRYQAKSHVIYQSAIPPQRMPRISPSRFQVSVIGHLRTVKDPFRTAMAVRRLPIDSKISVIQVGQAMTEGMRSRAERENKNNDRYCWIGNTTPSKARNILAASHLTVVSSKVEGSSNVLSEALVSGVPVLATRIPGLTGTLGHRYPGLYPCGDTSALRELLLQAEGDAAFLSRLRAEGRKLSPLVSPAKEEAAWKTLLTSIS